MMLQNKDKKKKKMEEYNINWLQILDQTYRMLITGDSGAGKTKWIFKLIIHQPQVDKIFTCYICEWNNIISVD